MKARSLCPLTGLALTFFFLLSSALAIANNGIRGRILDPLGAHIPNATVELLADGKQIKQTTTDADGMYRFEAIDSGRYTIRATAAGFRQGDSAAVVVHQSGDTTVDLNLLI